MAKKRHFRRGRQISLSKAAGGLLGLYETETAGGTTTVTNTIQAGAGNVARQTVIGFTGYDLQTGQWTWQEALRFWGPAAAGWILSWAGRKLVGPVKLSRKLKLF